VAEQNMSGGRKRANNEQRELTVAEETQIQRLQIKKVKNPQNKWDPKTNFSIKIQTRLHKKTEVTPLPPSFNY
jgi:hypothetical protein